MLLRRIVFPMRIGLSLFAPESFQRVDPSPEVKALRATTQPRDVRLARVFDAACQDLFCADPFLGFYRRALRAARTSDGRDAGERSSLCRKLMRPLLRS